MVSTTRINMHNKMSWKNLGRKRWWKQSPKTLKFQRTSNDWQSRGHGFEPRMLHHNKNETPTGVSFLLLLVKVHWQLRDLRDRIQRWSFCDPLQSEYLPALILLFPCFSFWGSSGCLYHNNTYGKKQHSLLSCKSQKNQALKNGHMKWIQNQSA